MEKHYVHEVLALLYMLIGLTVVDIADSGWKVCILFVALVHAMYSIYLYFMKNEQ